jgi:hypothetical protein
MAKIYQHLTTSMHKQSDCSKVSTDSICLMRIPCGNIKLGEPYQESIGTWF